MGRRHHDDILSGTISVHARMALRGGIRTLVGEGWIRRRIRQGRIRTCAAPVISFSSPAILAVTEEVIRAFKSVNDNLPLLKDGRASGAKDTKDGYMPCFPSITLVVCWENTVKEASIRNAAGSKVFRI